MSSLNWGPSMVFFVYVCRKWQKPDLLIIEKIQLVLQYQITVVLFLHKAVFLHTFLMKTIK